MNDTRAASQLPLLDVLSPLWTRWRLLALVFILTLFIALCLVPFVKPRYSSEAVLILDRASNDIATFDTALTSLVIDSEAIATETEILFSSELAASIVESQGLLSTREFNPEGHTPDDVKAVAVRQFLRQLQVQRKGISRAIVVKFESIDATRAARIANAVVDGYLELELERKIERESIAERRLSEEIDALKIRIADSEVQIADYRRQVGQSGSGDESQREKNIAGLNAERVLAQSQSKAADARLQQARALADNPAAFVSLPPSEISAALPRLRDNELELRTTLDRLRLTYGNKHPQVLSVRAQLERTRRDIGIEIDKSLQVLEGTTENARKLVDTLTAEMQSLEQAESSTWSSRAQLLALERERESDIDRLDFYATRLRELSQSSSIENLQPFARVITSGQVSDVAEFPNRRNLLVLLPVLATLGCLGWLVIFGLFKRFTLGSLPLLPGNTSWFGRVPSVSAIRKFLRRDGALGDRQLLASLRNLCDSLETALARSGQVVMFTGLRQGDGASTLAVGVARQFAQSGHSSLLIDLNMRQPVATAKARVLYSSEVLTGHLTTSALNHALQREKRAGLYRLSVQMKSASVDDTSKKIGDVVIEDLLASKAFEKLLQDLSVRYSRVVLDLPSVLNAPDSAIVSRLVDLAVIVATPAGLTAHAAELYRGIDRLKLSSDTLIGVVLNRMSAEVGGDISIGYVASDHHLARTIEALRAPSREPGKSVALVVEDLNTASVTSIIPSRLRGESWLLRQSAQQYTLCLMTTLTRPECAHAASGESASLPLACYMRQAPEGHVEYVMLLGLFDSFQTALDMVDRLVADPRQRDTAVLSLSTVHRDILNYRSAARRRGREQSEQNVA